MSNLFLKIFNFFQTRKTLLWLLLVLLAAGLSFSVSRISFVEDISSFFPNNAENRRVNEAFQKIGATNRIIVTVSQKDTSQGIDEDLLIDAVSRFSEILLHNDSDGHISELIYEIDSEQIREVTDFITQNLPFFLTEADYQRMDTLLQFQNLENQLRANRELLLSPMGGFVRNVILNDPLQLSQNALRNLELFSQGDDFNIDNGFIFNNEGECVVIITSRHPISETNYNRLLVAEIYSAINQTIAEFDNKINIVPFGPALISITNAERIRKDTLFSVSIALVLILVLLFYFFRNAKSLFFIALSIGFGALFSFGIIVLFKSTVSIIAIGVASIIFGIAINYPLHFLAHFQRKQNIKETIKEIVNPLLIGNITTVGAFFSILFISSDAMRDLGMFSSFLLVGTIIFVLIFLPQFLKPGTKKVAEVKELKFGRLAEFRPERNKITVFIFLIFTVVLFFFSFGTKFETNLHAINYMTAEQRAEMDRLMEQNTGKQTLFVVVEGINIEDALQNYEKSVLPNLSNHASVSGISNLFPSQKLQQQKIERWNNFWENRREEFTENFNQIAREQGFQENVFERFFVTLNNNFQPQTFEYFAPIFNNLGENYFAISEDNVLIYTLIQQSPYVSESEIFISDNHAVFTFSDISIAQKMVNALSDDFNTVLYICGFIVFAFLFFSFGRIELATMTFLPLVMAWIWILGLMNIFDLRFNIVNIILATFIFGQGDDYTIFVSEGLIYEYSRGKKMLASFKNTIILSASTLFIAIGALIFAQHPALRSLAELAIVGMVSVVICAFLFPPLIFRFLTSRKGKLREVPWTITRFVRSLYAFFVFLFGCLLSRMYGFVLLGFRKQPSEKNKLRYHRFLQWEADFVIRRVPGTKFRYENLAKETFDKPAVIIANHQSHLDLMCLMMLTPKLIILTNDWVWNSPFFGKMIRYADYYPVSQGIENSIEQLSDAVNRGYSIVVFPEGTRSPDSTIKRFHKGAFYLAETLKLDIIPVFLHGIGHVLPKNDFLLRKGEMTVQVHERITPNDSRFATDYQTRTKQIRHYYRETFAEISRKIETSDYFKSFVMHNYMYKGVEIWRGAKKELRQIKIKQITKLNENTVLIENNGYGVFSFLYALVNKNTNVIAIENDEDKVAIAKNCVGIPQNLAIYNVHEFHELTRK